VAKSPASVVVGASSAVLVHMRMRASERWQIAELEAAKIGGTCRKDNETVKVVGNGMRRGRAKMRYPKEWVV
jgi:hypothetical protein